MTIEFATGFDLTTTNASLAMAGWTVTGTAAAGTGRNGIGSALKFTNGSGWTARKALPLSLATRVVGIALKQNAYDGAYGMLDLYEGPGTTQQINIGRGSAGELTVRRGGSVLGTTAPIWPSGGFGVWHFVELVSTIHDTTGSYQLWVDGVQLLSATNVDTRNGGAAGLANHIQLQGYANSDWEFDDLYVGDTRLGDRRVVPLLVTANATAGVAWTPSAGSNFQCVDDNPLSAAEYNQATAAGLRDQFVLADMPATPVMIDAVIVNTIHNKQDSGARTMRGGLVSGAATGNGGTFSPVLSQNNQNQAIFHTDPNTAAAWTLAGVNAIEPFYETVT